MIHKSFRSLFIFRLLGTATSIRCASCAANVRVAGKIRIGEMSKLMIRGFWLVRIKWRIRFSGSFNDRTQGDWFGCDPIAR
jgi:hypothetical protein